MIVKDDAGNYAVFTEQGASASQMTGANVLDNMPRLPGCSGQGSDAVSAYTQVEMTDAPKLFHLSEEEGPKIRTRSPKARIPQHRDSIDDPAVPPERNLYDQPLGKKIWESSD